MMTKQILYGITVLFCYSVSISASATIVSGEVTGGKSLEEGGSFTKLSVPFTESNPINTVGRDTFNNPNLYGFDEDQNIKIADDLVVDILADGKGGSRGKGVIRAGKTVASHYIFYDPKRRATQTGRVIFDSNIVGIITSKVNLSASDSLANTGVTYQRPGLRGLEKPTDKVSILGPRTIRVDWRAGSPGDYIRVLTEFSPGAVFLLPD
jgi:hypothetical protein